MNAFPIRIRNRAKTLFVERQLSETRDWLSLYIPSKALPPNLTAIPDAHLLDLHPFSVSRPEMYYKENILEQYLSFHIDYFSSAGTAEQLLRDTAANFSEAWFALEALSVEMAAIRLDRLPRKTAFRSYVLPWFAHRLCEDIYANLIRLPIIILEKQRGKNYQALTVNQQVNDILSNHNDLFLIAGYYDSHVRNAASHPGGQIFFERDETIKLLDREVEKTYSDDELVRMVEDLYDSCQAMSLATKLLRVRYLGYRINQAGADLSEDFRERHLCRTVSDNLLWIDEIERISLSPFQSGFQVNIRFDHKFTRKGAVFTRIISELPSIRSHFPEGDHAFFLSFRVGEMPHWIRVQGATIDIAVSGNLSLSGLLENCELSPFLIPLQPEGVLGGLHNALGLGNIVVRNIVDQIGSTLLANNLHKPDWRVVQAGDASITHAIRKDCTVVVRRNADRAEVKRVVRVVIDDEIAKSGANYVWVRVFDQEKRSRDMITIDEIKCFVCLAEYYDGVSDELDFVHGQGDEEEDHIRFTWRKA